MHEPTVAFLHDGGHDQAAGFPFVGFEVVDDLVDRFGEVGDVPGHGGDDVLVEFLAELVGCVDDLVVVRVDEFVASGFGYGFEAFAHETVVFAADRGADGGLAFAEFLRDLVLGLAFLLQPPCEFGGLLAGERVGATNLAVRADDLARLLTAFAIARSTVE